jgi:hypothetical protein
MGAPEPPARAGRRRRSAGVGRAGARPRRTGPPLRRLRARIAAHGHAFHPRAAGVRERRHRPRKDACLHRARRRSPVDAGRAGGAPGQPLARAPWRPAAHRPGDLADRGFSSGRLWRPPTSSSRRGARTDRAARPRAYTAPGRAGLTGPPPVARPAPLGPAGYGEDAHGPVPHGPGRRRDHDPPIGSNARHAERVRGAGAPPCPLSCRARRRRPDRAGTDVRPSPPAPGVSTWPSRSRFPTLQLGAGCSSSTAEGSTSPSTIPMRSSSGPRASPRRSSRSSCVELLSSPPRPAARP